MILNSDENESCSLDVIFNELFCRKGELNMIVAPKRMGKTSFALTMLAKGVIEYDDKYLWLSSELPVSRLVDMLNTNLTKKVLGHNIINYERNKFIDELIAVFDFEMMFTKFNQIFNFETIRNLITKLEEEAKVDCIIIDCIKGSEVISNLNINHSSNFNNYMHSLKKLAIELNKTIVLLYEIENEGSYLNITPEIIDTFCFIYRPEFYKIVEYEDGCSTLGDAHFVFKKKDEYNMNQLLKYDATSYRFY